MVEGLHILSDASGTIWVDSTGLTAEEEQAETGMSVIFPCLTILRKAAPVAEWVRSLYISAILIIRSSHRCVWCRFDTRTGHM